MYIVKLDKIDGPEIAVAVAYEVDVLRIKKFMADAKKAIDAFASQLVREEREETASIVAGEAAKIGDPLCDPLGDAQRRKLYRNIDSCASVRIEDEMDTKQAVELRKQLERDVLQLLKDYQEKTSLTPTAIDVDIIHTTPIGGDAGRQMLISRVQVRVEA